MIWVPPDIAATCPAHTHLTACSPFAYVFLNLVASLFGDSYDRRVQEEHPPAPVRDGEVYDFIVVGAGSAGCVVANRLSAVEKWKVLLLEAGPEEPDVTLVPSLAPTLIGSNIDWQYKTMPTPHACTAFTNGQCSWPRGKTMGGTSSINTMVYVRGNRADFDGWEHLGNPGWSYADVLPYFKKSERNLNIEELDHKYHGVRGEQGISRFPYIDESAIVWTRAFTQRGFPFKDINGRSQFGSTIIQSFSEAGQRVSSNRAYIRPIRYKRKNLVVRPEAMVKRILIDNHKRAYGVKYVKDGRILTAYANKEIIVSGGAINSPQLLMLSGIGPEEHLNDLNIPVVQDLRVGENLHNHVSFAGLITTLPKGIPTVSTDEILDLLVEYKKMEKKDGPMSSSGPTTSMAFYRTDPLVRGVDVQFHVYGINREEFFREPSIYNDLLILPLASYDSNTIRVINNAPYSRGKILLNATDPDGHPLIYSGYLEDPRDVETLLRGVRKLLTVENTEILRSKGVHFVRRPVEACKHFRWGTDAYFACLARSYTYGPIHPVGTCKMGPKSDPGAVVDSRLRVYGVSGLRVIDASIMPIVTQGNTNAPAMMIGERGVAFVLEDWLCNYKSKC